MGQKRVQRISWSMIFNHDYWHIYRARNNMRLAKNLDAR
jgi:hypothetical protein